jgi:hypothetical protein
MTFSKQTNQVKISSQSMPRYSTIDTFLIHHQAGMNDDAVIAAMVSGSKGVSANYTISNEGRITCVVEEENRAYTSGSLRDGGKGAAWDHRAVTVEIENESGDPDWRISAKALDAAARLLIDLRSRYTIRHVLGHRDLWNTYGASYPTFCPGPETVMKIVSLAKTKLAGTGGQEIIEPKPEEEEMSGYQYVSGIDPVTKKSRWALSHPLDFPDGVLITSDIKVASGFAPLSGNSFDAGTDVARWDAFIKVAKIASDAAWARETRIAALSGVDTKVYSGVDMKPVLDAINAIPAAVRTNLIKE